MQRFKRWLTFGITSEKYIRWQIKYAYLILAVGIVSAGAGTYFSSKLGFNSDFTALLPDDAPSVVDLDVVTEKAGGVGYLVLALEAQNVESAKKFADMLAPELENLPEITYVDYKIDRPFFDAKTLLFVDTEDLITIRERLAERVVRERKK
ncbi:MAG: hypothetical protein HY391_03845, partial [Deltaproteobacteria bacterium]|nr:hypothetical protein [Deltaproteobacteria bacterium]